MKRAFQTAFCGLLLFSCLVTLTAQEREILPSRQPDELVDAKPKRCWENELSLDVISQSTPADEIIIVIGRLGDKDLKPNLNKRRLHNVRAYWTQYLTGAGKRNPQTVIVAEGEPMKGLGQVEFYVRGRLVEVFKTRPNSDLYAAECYVLPDEPQCAEEKQKLFYPCKDRIGKRQQKRKVVFSKRPSAR